MKHFPILFLICMPFCLFSQKAKLKIFPVDDCSQIRENYKSLFNNSDYFFIIEGDKENVEIQLDSNLIVIIDDKLVIRNRTGKTNIRLTDLESKITIYELSLNILALPKITLNADTSGLKAKGIVKVHPIDETGRDLRKEFKIGYMTVHYYDDQNKYLYSVPSDSNELYFKLTGSKITEVCKIRIETLVLSEENGRCLNLPDKVIEIRNDH